MTAPMMAVTAEIPMVDTKSLWMFGSANAFRLASVNAPALVKKPLPTASAAGITRNRTM